MPTRLFLLLSPLFFFAQSAEGATGIVVRLITGGETVESPVVVTLTNADGTAHSATLLDNGEPPDVNPGDYHFSGSTMLEGEGFTVSLSLGDATEEIGEVSWPADITARDLIITRYEGIVTLASNRPIHLSAEQVDAFMGRSDRLAGELRRRFEARRELPQDVVLARGDELLAEALLAHALEQVDRKVHRHHRGIGFRE